jgi:hypothetical protein
MFCRLQMIPHAAYAQRRWFSANQTKMAMLHSAGALTEQEHATRIILPVRSPIRYFACAFEFYLPPIYAFYIFYLFLIIYCCVSMIDNLDVVQEIEKLMPKLNWYNDDDKQWQR